MQDIWPAGREMVATPVCEAEPGLRTEADGSTAGELERANG